MVLAEMNCQIFRAIGMISGTSIDGIDTALIETDGVNHVKPLAFMPYAYEPAFRAKIRENFGNKPPTQHPATRDFECALTSLHADVLQRFMTEHAINPSSINLVGFHGQTIWHRPDAGETIQLGDGQQLADLVGLPVVNDFRSADVRAGGHGAPLVPLYHRALAASLPLPVAIINIGGVSNITWIGSAQDQDMLAFDMGPGNALLDDWMLRHSGRAYDEHGLTANAGKVDEDYVSRVLAHPFFAASAPKSLDRQTFHDFKLSGLSLEDGAATLTMVTVRAIAAGLKLLPELPLHIYLTGGGRLNLTLMRWLESLTDIPVSSVDDLGWSGDGLEAEAFAYLAVRSQLGLPLSLPGTTGVRQPCGGGVLHRPALAVSASQPA
jgi:anhydro-N-acetylmuramic acid kinase